MAGLFGSPEIQRLAEDDPEEYYKQTPFVRSLWESRLPTWLGQAYKQDVKPAIDAASAPTMEQVLRAPYNLASGAVKGAIDTIDSAQKDPSDPRKMLELALMTGAGGLLGGAPRGSLGMFAGRRAKTANLEKMKIAQKMLDDGVERTDVWKQTGWMRGPDGKMRFEIDDSAARLDMDAIPPSQSRLDLAQGYSEATYGIPAGRMFTGKNPDRDTEVLKWADDNIHLAREGETSLPTALTHDDAFAAYPDAKKIRLGKTTGKAKGIFDPDSNKIKVGGGVIGRSPDEHKSTALHELQHAIQGREGFASGGSMDSAYMDGTLRKQWGEGINTLLQPRSRKEYMKIVKAGWPEATQKQLDKSYRAYLKDAKKALRDPYHPAAKAAQETVAERMYKSLAGEAEARNVQTRMDYSPEQRLDEPPWTTLDVPEADQIVRGATDGSQMSIPMDEASRMARAKETAEMRRKGNIERFGYDPNDAASTAAFEDTSYRMQHQPRGPDSDDPIRLDELTRSTNGNTAGYPDDFYGSDGSRLYAPGPRFSGDEGGISNIESYNIAKKVRGNPEGVVTIYRAVPNEDKINKINQGDFVTLSPKYAEVHGSSGYGRSGNDPGKIISEEVKVKDVYWAGDDINEFGYFPQSSTKTPKAKPSPAMLRALLKDPDVL